MGVPQKQADESTDKLRECDSDKGEGVKKIRKFCGCHMYMPPKKKQLRLGPYVPRVFRSLARPVFPSWKCGQILFTLFLGVCLVHFGNSHLLPSVICKFLRLEKWEMCAFPWESGGTTNDYKFLVKGFVTLRLTMLSLHPKGTGAARFTQPFRQKCCASSCSKYSRYRIL